MLVVRRLDEWFAEQLVKSKLDDVVKAYAVSVLARGEDVDMSTESVVLAYAFARQKHDFSSYQRIGDWALWSGCVTGHDNVIDVIGRKSYSACHSLLRMQWPVYHELAIDLRGITKEIRAAVSFGQVPVNR